MFFGVTLLITTGLGIGSASPGKGSMNLRLPPASFNAVNDLKIGLEIVDKIEEYVNKKAADLSEMKYRVASFDSKDQRNKTYIMSCVKGSGTENVSIEIVKVWITPSSSATGQYAFMLTSVPNEQSQFKLNSSKISYIMKAEGLNDGNSSLRVIWNGDFYIEATININTVVEITFPKYASSGATRVYDNENRQLIRQNCTLDTVTRADVEAKVLRKVTKSILRKAVGGF